MEKQQSASLSYNPKTYEAIPQISHFSTPAKHLQQTTMTDATSYFNVHQYTQLEQVPFMNTKIQYEDRQVIEMVPVQKKVIEQREVRKIKKVPVQRMVIDYLPIQKQIFYVPTYVPETKIEYVPVEVKTERLEYVQRSRSIVHMPQKYQPGNTNYQYASNTYNSINPQTNIYSTPNHSYVNIKKDVQSTGPYKQYIRPSSARRPQVIATTPINSLNHKNLDWKYDNKNDQLQNQIIIKDAKETTTSKFRRNSFGGDVERNSKGISFTPSDANARFNK